MFPFYDGSKIGSTIPEGGIVDPEDNLECPPAPEGATSTPDSFFCGNTGEPQDYTLLNSKSFVQVYYSSFNTIKNVNGNGGAVYLNIPRLSTIDISNTIKFYHSTFFGCQALKGFAIYLESSDPGRIFDFNHCTFDSNRFGDKNTETRGGGIYIESSVSCFKFTNCLFSNNYAIYGAGLYYVSDESSSSNDANNFALQLSDCHFFENQLSEAGGSVYISITSNASPRPIDISRCVFEGATEPDGVFEEEYENGGAIYYSLNCQSSEAPSDPSTGIDSCFCVSECTFTLNQISNLGGGIYISIANNEPYKPIEITGCLFNENAAIYALGDVGSLGFGGAIYCVLSQCSESTNSNSNPSLTINKCRFVNCFALKSGGSICFSIENSQSSRSIEVYNCSYSFHEWSYWLGNEDVIVTQNGGFIAFIVESGSDKNPPLHISNCTLLSNIDTFFNDPNSFEIGGIIYIDVRSCQQTGTIEINDCKFYHVVTNAEISYGGSIYYTSKTVSTSTSSHTALSISNCEFLDSEVKNFGGSIYIQFENDESQKQIEITGCKFQRTTLNNDNAVYIKSNKKANTVKLDDCTFENCMIYLETLSATIGNSKFNNIASDKHAIYYKNSPAQDFEATVSVEKYHFVQTSQVDSLVYFETVLSSKFSFTDNIINFTGTDSHVLGCQTGFQIQEGDQWHFLNNAIDPEDELVIKTTDAEKIPAFCGDGFTCVATPKNCDQNSRCELKLPDDATELPAPKELNNQVYDNLNTTEYGGVIRFINHPLTCIGSTFTLCKAENGGGGGIYIVVKNPHVETTFNIEKCEFKNCVAKFGGAIYIYCNQQKCDFLIKKCTFEQNTADTTAPAEAEKAHLFGGSAIYLQTKTGKVLRCTFRKNVGSGVKVFHQDDLDAPNSDISQSSLRLNSKAESSIEIKDCFFEADKLTSSSSLFYVREGKKQFPINVVDCTFAGKLPKGSFHIDGDSISIKDDKLKIKVEKCKFASDKKLALNSKLNVVSFDVNSQQFNYNGAENTSSEPSKHARSDFSLIAVAAMTISVLVAISLAVVIIIKKKKNSQEESADNDENAAEENATEL